MPWADSISFQPLCPPKLQSQSWCKSHALFTSVQTWAGTLNPGGWGESASTRLTPSCQSCQMTTHSVDSADTSGDSVDMLIHLSGPWWHLILGGSYSSTGLLAYDSSEWQYPSAGCIVGYMSELWRLCKLPSPSLPVALPWYFEPGLTLFHPFFMFLIPEENLKTSYC